MGKEELRIVSAKVRSSIEMTFTESNEGRLSGS